LADETGQELSAVFLGTNIADRADDAFQMGADKVFVVDDPLFEDYLTESYTTALERLCKQETPEILLLGQTLMGRDLAPKTAFRLRSGITLDCIDLSIDPDTKRLKKTKPVYGGNAVAEYISEGEGPQMATIRPKVMSPNPEEPSRTGDVILFDPGINPSDLKTRFVGRKESEYEGIKLTDADIIICGGRGMGGPESFQVLEDLAKVLHGAVGASRPPCDHSWVPSHYQIGLTGELVSPNLYIAVAVSGASQHLAGMQGSKNIVAINKNAKAGIFRVAKYGIVGDYKSVLPGFMEKCKELLI
jgi:electron transfer flavoprotein alpha subunit